MEPLKPGDHVIYATPTDPIMIVKEVILKDGHREYVCGWQNGGEGKFYEYELARIRYVDYGDNWALWVTFHDDEEEHLWKQVKKDLMPIILPPEPPPPIDDPLQSKGGGSFIDKQGPVIDPLGP